MSNHNLTRLSFDTINELSNGAVAVAVDEAIRRALLDLHNSRDGESRKIILQMALRASKDGRDKFEVTPTVEVKLPQIKPQKTLCNLKVTGDTAEGLFKASSARNPDQLTFDDLEVE